MKPSILAAILAAAFFLAPLAYAETTAIPIGNPYTDTLQLWSSIAASVEFIGQDAVSAAGQLTTAMQQLASTVVAPHPQHTTNRPPAPPPASAAEQSASLAAAVASSEGASNTPATSTETELATSSGTRLDAASDQTTLSQNVNSALNPPLTNQSEDSELATSASNFVTEPELTAQLQQFSNSFTSKFNSAQFLTVPAWAPSQAINNLSNVTITNANLTASEIPALNYLSLSGGTLSGALNVPTLNASSTNYGLLTATDASTSLLSIFDTAYFGGTATSTFDSAGDLTLGGSLIAPGSVTLGNATTTSLFSTTASSTNLFAQAASFGTLTAGALLLSAPLSVANGGTGQLSFGQGWLSSNGSTLSASTSPTINYLTATSTTATSTFSGNLAVTGTANFSTVNLFGNKTYSGASSASNSFFYMPGSSLFGTASAAPNGIISPFNLYISGDQVDTTTNGNGNLIDFSIDGAVSNGETGGREAFQSYLNLVGTPAVAPGAAGYVGGQFMLRGSANLTGTSGSYANYAGAAFASNANVYLTAGATFYKLVNGEEFDVTVPNGASTADKYGISIVQGSNDAVRGTYDDSAISINNQDGASAGWHYGISFGSYAHQWAFATDSTLIMAQQRQTGPSSPSVALNGVDFRNVTFGGYAFASSGFTVDGSGNITGEDLYASSSPGVTFAGLGAGSGVIGTATSSSPTSGAFSTAFGYQALGNATSSAFDSVAIGYEALMSSALVSSPNGENTAVGYESLKGNTSGSTNVAVGDAALASNTTGNNNAAVGATALQFNTTGSDLTALGRQALANNSTGFYNTAVGLLALGSIQTGSANTAVGAFAGEGVASNSFGNDSLFGDNAGFALTTGSNNVFIGKDAASTTATGANNILLGYDLDLPSANGSNQLDIGNLIFGANLSGSYGLLPVGNIAIGTTTPYSRLEVWGPDTASTTAFVVANSASTTEFSVYDTGNAFLAGGLTQNSDERLKTNIQSLDASSSLSLIDELNPITFNWIDPSKGTTPQLGFIAQQVLPIFPNLVSTTSPTSLTPDGTLSLNYIGLISPIVSAVQALSAEITSMENTIAYFAQSFASNNITANNELCVGSTCVTPAQFQAMVAAANVPQSSEQGSSSTSDETAGNSQATDTPPVIQVNGDDPAIVQVGDTYNDLGAMITGPQDDLNLGITTYVNGVETNPVQIDTSEVATDTIDYVVTDQNGLTSTTTRTVLVEAPSIVPSDDASTTATTSASTTPTQ